MPHVQKAKQTDYVVTHIVVRTMKTWKKHVATTKVTKKV